MTIRNIDHYVAALWDWDCLSGCFGNSRIRVSDLDGIIERNGRFLVLEAKSHGASVSTGQRRMFDEMAKTGVFTIIVLFGETNNPQRMRVTTQQEDGRVVSVEKQASMADVRDMVQRWYRFANTVSS
jgi:hypothetical protein